MSWVFRSRNGMLAEVTRNISQFYAGEIFGIFHPSFFGYLLYLLWFEVVPYFSGLAQPSSVFCSPDFYNQTRIIR